MTSLALLSCLVLSWPDPPAQEPAGAAIAPADVVSALENAIADSIAKAEQSVVAIHRSKGENNQETLAVRGRKRPANMLEQTRRFGLDRLQRLPELPNMISFDFGSGVVIGDHGEILTMYHVVKGARELRVRAVGRQEFEAEIIAADPRSDLAVIAPVESDGNDGPRLKPIAIGDAGKLRKGSFLIALGNPFNAAKDGKPSASWGILSNIARKLDPDMDDLSPRVRTARLANYPTLLQLDSKLNLGMSGGAVINLKGELVGLTTMASSPGGFDAMAGYAVPMDKLGRRAVETLKEGKEIEYGLLGIQADNNFTNRVGDVRSNSPAALGQLVAGDEIIEVNNTPVVDFDTLVLAVNIYSAGDMVRLKIRRGDETIERSVVLAKVPVEGEVVATNRPKPWRGLRVDYTSTLNFLTFGPNQLDPTNVGVVVADVEEGSAGAAAGIKKGQVIKKVAGKSLRSPRDFYEAIATLDGPVTLETDLGPVTVK
jgi:serine protease Do